MTATRRTQAERTQATRAALLDAARALFAAEGFARTGREQIVQRAGVTRGALYHHFESKEGLFRELVELLEAEIVDRVVSASARGRDARARLSLGSHAFLDGAMDPAFRRIVLLDAPAVLGPEVWREIDERHGLGLLTMALDEAMAEGLIERQPVRPLAQMLLGALNEAAMVVATAKRPKAARAEMGRTVDFVLERLLV